MCSILSDQDKMAGYVPPSNLHLISITAKGKMLPSEQLIPTPSAQILAERSRMKTELFHIEGHVKGLFEKLLEANEGHPRNLDRRVQVQSDGYTWLHPDTWGSAFYEWKKLKIVVDQVKTKFEIKSISPATFQLERAGTLMYRVVVTVTGPCVHWRYRAKRRRLVVMVTLSYNHSLYSRALTAMITHITSPEEMVELKQFLQETALDKSKADLAQLASLYLDSDLAENWQLMMTAGAKALLPGVTGGDAFDHKHLT